MVARIIGMLQSWTKVEVTRAGRALWEGGREEREGRKEGRAGGSEGGKCQMCG